MNTEVAVIAKFTLKPQLITEGKAFLTELIEPTNNEPGCIFYHLYQDENNANQFVMIERYTDRTAFEKHLQMPYLLAAHEKFADYLEKPADVKVYPSC